MFRAGARPTAIRSSIKPRITAMSFSMSVQDFAIGLNALSAVLDKGAAHAAAKKIDPAVLLQSRLAPDMFPLVRQVQIACDMVKNGFSRLCGVEAPVFEDKI